MRFLIIDDNVDFCSVIRDLLEDYKHVEVRRCTSAAEAFAAIEEVRPGILFIDHDLTEKSMGGPGGEGLEIARAVCGRIKVVSITGRGDYETLAAYAELDVIVVPKTDFGEIIHIIEIEGLTTE